eukprot:5249244-Prymnesium_polylepis.1
MRSAPLDDPVGRARARSTFPLSLSPPPVSLPPASLGDTPRNQREPGAPQDRVVARLAESRRQRGGHQGLPPHRA